MKTIKVKLTTPKGETITNDDGSPMLFILVNEAELREIMANCYNCQNQKNYHVPRWNACSEHQLILKILGDE